eukprot:scaffold3717_cov268-Pinguiococcus_pyrenoidosus.AAC.2
MTGGNPGSYQWPHRTRERDQKRWGTKSKLPPQFKSSLARVFFRASTHRFVSRSSRAAHLASLSSAKRGRRAEVNLGGIGGATSQCDRLCRFGTAFARLLAPHLRR